LKPPVPPADYREHLRLMIDLTVLALWTDSTRVVSLQFANEAGNRSYRAWIDGLAEPLHHTASHYAKDARKIDSYNRIVRWQVEQWTYLVERLRAIREGGTSLLDNSMALLCSGLGDGNAHRHDNLPVLLAGRGGGAFAPGRYLAYPAKTRRSNLYLPMLTAMGSPAERFADSTGPLAALTGGEPPKPAPVATPAEPVKS